MLRIQNESFTLTLQLVSTITSNFMYFVHVVIPEFC